MNDQLAAEVIWWALGDYGGGGTGINIVGCIACDVSNKDNGGPIVTPVRP